LMSGVQKDRGIGQLSAHLGDRVEPALTRHLDIEDDDVWS